jgi:hypothetical protein
MVDQQLAARVQERLPIVLEMKNRGMVDVTPTIS